jgi:teichuronic acid biosynthesis glycosyltransferase TuaG
MSTPLVSIITPAYNAAEFILETINSVQAQTYSHWEMIIVDDGSTDLTASIIQSETKKDSRIHYYYQTNGKQGKARNLAIKHAKGKYLAFIDADDLWHPQKLEKQIQVFLDNPQVGLIYTNGNSFKEKIEVVDSINEGESLFIDNKRQYHLLLAGKSLPNLSVMVKKRLVDEIGGFQEDIRLQNAEDYQLWLRLADNGCQFYYLSLPLFYYRLHEKQVTHQDRMAFKQAIWAEFLAPLKQISVRQKEKIIFDRVQKYLLSNIDTLNTARFVEINHLLCNPLQKYSTWMFNNVLLILGKRLYKAYYYRKINNEK